MNMSPRRVLHLFGQQPVKTNIRKPAHSSHHPDPSSAQLYFLVFESFKKELLILLFQANMGHIALGHIFQNWLTNVSIISRAECGRTISGGQFFSGARQTSKVLTACFWGTPFSNKGPICTTEGHIFFVLWIGQPIHETKTKYGLLWIAPIMVFGHAILYCTPNHGAHLHCRPRCFRQYTVIWQEVSHCRCEEPR